MNNHIQHSPELRTAPGSPAESPWLMRLVGLVVVAGGALAGWALVPTLAPLLGGSLTGTEPKGYWYLARSSAVVAYVLLWASVMAGMSITGRLARIWSNGPRLLDLHRHTALLGMGFAVFHALILLGDTYIDASLAQVLIPFGYTGYQPFWVGLGQVAIWLLALVLASTYAKPLIGQRVWRAIHRISFAVFALALAHGLFSGTDSATPLMQILYRLTGSSAVFLLVYRICVRYEPRRASGSRPASR